MAAHIRTGKNELPMHVLEAHPVKIKNAIALRGRAIVKTISDRVTSRIGVLLTFESGDLVVRLAPAHAQRLKADQDVEFVADDEPAATAQ